MPLRKPLLSFILPTLLFAQSALPPKPAYPYNIKQLHCGHSLTAPLFSPWPGQYCHLVAQMNNLPAWQVRDVMVGDATIPGAWLRFHWDTTLMWCGQNPPPCYGHGLRPRADINLWQLLIVTENYEGPVNLNAHQSREHLLNFVQNSWQHGNGGNGTPTLLWTNWAGIDGSPYYFGGSYGIPAATDGSASGWRRLMDSLEVGWQRMQDYANANRPSGCPPVYIIPGNRVMVRLYDDIQQGQVPGITHIRQLFTDGVHANDTCAYLVALIHYACIFNANPIGLSNQLQPGVTIPPALANYFQRMAWRVVTSYPRSGLTHLASTLDRPAQEERIEVFPNPTTEWLWVRSLYGVTATSPLRILDMQGRVLREATQYPVYVGDLPSGTYIAELRGSKIKWIKE